MNLTWRNKRAPRLILGTVQLGMPYGIANLLGKPDLSGARSIMETALEHGLNYFDTAQAYGESETILGSVLADLGSPKEACICSKISPYLDSTNAKEINASIERTFERLRVEKLWCMMLHEPKTLSTWDLGLGDALRRYRAQGRIEYLGVSLRTSADAKPALENPDIDIIQAPCNAWDRRVVESGSLRQAWELGKLCCIRSVYLQGLLTMSPDVVLDKLPVAYDASVRWWALARQFHNSPPELAMRYALTLNAPLVVGAETSAQLEETIQMADLEPLAPPEIAMLAAAVDPLLHEGILEPGRWYQRD